MKSPVLKITSSVKYKQTQQGNGMAIDMASGDMLELNETGHEVFRRIDGRKTVQEIVRELCEEYDASEDEISRDVLDIIEKMKRAKFLEEVRG